jgi:hypothetical protein
MTRHPFLQARLFAPLFLLVLAISASAQTPTEGPESAQNQASRPKVVAPPTEQPIHVLGVSSLYCAGYIKYQKFAPTPEIVGAEREEGQRTFATGDIVYVNYGSEQGMKEGQTFQIVRPRGDVKGVHRHKVGFLGTYVQEVGQLELFKVRENTSAARIIFACDSVLLGDLLTGIPGREPPVRRPELAIDRFADPSGKQSGVLMMARDGREMVAQSDVVYIDLGSEDQIKSGDYLTIYRPLGTGNVTRVDNEEQARGRATGFQSDRYRGGGVGSQAQRAKDSTAFVKNEGRYRYKPITTRQIKRDRPLMPRKIVGEMVVIDVQARTATAVITRSTSEVHTGDWVELQ